ncbi:MAG: hypothetical protein ACKPKO_57115, partial [Candidatus Fonsibacter sp.]
RRLRLQPPSGVRLAHIELTTACTLLETSGAAFPTCCKYIYIHRKTEVQGHQPSPEGRGCMRGT